MILAFIPMYCVAVGYKELNEAEPDSGTTFIWATRAFGPRTGWMGGWGIVAADVIVMANLAAIAGSVLLPAVQRRRRRCVDVLANCRGRRVDRRDDLHLLHRHRDLGRGSSTRCSASNSPCSLVFSVVALDPRVHQQRVDGVSLHPALSWFNPFRHLRLRAHSRRVCCSRSSSTGASTRRSSINEETRDPGKTPGRAAVIATVVLLIIYVIVTTAAQAYAGIGDSGRGLSNPDNSGDTLSVLGHAVFGSAWYGSLFTHLLILMVLSSAAASTLTTILPTARTTLAMAAHKAIPAKFATIHTKYLTPTWSTVGMGIASIVFYLLLTWRSPNLLGRHDRVDRTADRVLLRPDRLRVCVVLPPLDLQVGAAPSSSAGSSRFLGGLILLWRVHSTPRTTTGPPTTATRRGP